MQIFAIICTSQSCIHVNVGLIYRLNATNMGNCIDRADEFLHSHCPDATTVIDSQCIISTTIIPTTVVSKCVTTTTRNIQNVTTTASLSCPSPSVVPATGMNCPSSPSKTAAANGNINPNIMALGALLSLSIVLLGMVITGWVCTCWITKKRNR